MPAIVRKYESTLWSVPHSVPHLNLASFYFTEFSLPGQRWGGDLHWEDVLEFYV